MKRLLKSKKAKGMSLVEIVIALFVFSVAALIMVQAGTVSNKLMRDSIHTNRKVSAQEPIVNTKTNFTGDGALVGQSSDSYRVKVSVGGNRVDIKCSSYSTEKADPDRTVDAEGNVIVPEVTYGTHGNLSYLVVPNSSAPGDNTLPVEADEEGDTE